jgi:chromosome partitioning protein
LVSTIKKVKSINPGLKIAGILRTMHDPRNNLANDVSAQLEQHFKDKVFKTIVPRNVTVAEAPSHGLPVILYDAKSRGAQAYLALGKEVRALLRSGQSD